MRSEEIVLSAVNLGKKHNRTAGKNNSDPFWSLKRVSFGLRKGEILGLIGPNGAGKSTLLKVLSEIVPPSEGEVTYSGRILSILDIGTGFHPDLSGYENIFLNASLLGMKKTETALKTNEIISFSGIGEFIHEPVKNYSSGMYVRLALSIALFINAEIVLLDEIVSAGDAEFRLKAAQEIRAQANTGRSFVIISHDLNLLRDLCDNCLLLEKGEIAAYGKAGHIIGDYLDKINQSGSPAKKTISSDACDFISASAGKHTYEISEAVEINILYKKKTTEELDTVIRIRTTNGLLMSDCSIYRPDYLPESQMPGIYKTTCRIPSNLFNEGNFYVDVLFGNKHAIVLEIKQACRFTMQLPAWEKEKKWNEGNDGIPLRPLCGWETRLQSSSDTRLV